MSTTLKEKRIYAAEVTEGISSTAIYKKMLDVISQRNLKGKVLDFGAGVGNLVRHLSTLQRFNSIDAVDLVPPPKDVQSMANWELCDLNESTPFPPDCFDVILSAEVIEHLENPRSVAREWFRLLKPGGVIVFTTPNNESIRSYVALLLKGHYTAFADQSYPGHITALLRKDVHRILGEAGFCHHEVLFSDCGGIPKIPGLKWQSVSFGFLRGRLFSDNLIAISSKPT